MFQITVRTYIIVNPNQKLHRHTDTDSDTGYDDGWPRDAPRDPNNSSEHKSSVRPEGSRAGHPRITAKRYCLGSIDLAYKILGYRCRLRAVKSEGGPEWRRSRSLDFR